MLGRYLLALMFGVALGFGAALGLGTALGLAPLRTSPPAQESRLPPPLPPLPTPPGRPAAPPAPVEQPPRLAAPPSLPTPAGPPSAPLSPSSGSAGVGVGRIAYDEELVAGIFERVGPSVVNVNSRVQNQDDQARVRQGTGSGFIVDRDGHILTNNHVVRDAIRVEVVLSDGSRLPAEVVGRDALNDIALLKVEAPTDQLPPVPLGDSAALRVGQMAVAIGNPFGLTRTLTVGVVSGLGRPIEDAGRRPLLDMVQTDAAINPGNSGGPLLNARGEVIGINTLIDRSQLAVGFAIPINTAKGILPSLIAGQAVQRPWVGISGINLTPILAEQLGLSANEGILVREAVANGPAAAAGIRGGPNDQPASGDVVRAIDGQPVRRVSDLVAAIDRRQVGETVSVTIIRNGEELAVPVVLGAFPDGS